MPRDYITDAALRPQPRPDGPGEWTTPSCLCAGLVDAIHTVTDAVQPTENAPVVFIGLAAVMLACHLCDLTLPDSRQDRQASHGSAAPRNRPAPSQTPPARVSSGAARYQKVPMADLDDEIPF
jgi:hypothetical protein